MIILELLGYKKLVPNYIFSYLPKLEGALQVIPSTADPKLPALKNPTDIQGWNIGSQPNSEAFKALIDQYQVMINIM